MTQVSLYLFLQNALTFQPMNSQQFPKRGNREDTLESACEKKLRQQKQQAVKINLFDQILC